MTSDPAGGVPDVITATWLESAFPQLRVVAIATHEVQVTRAGCPIVLRLKLAHDDVEPEALATWPGVTQRFAVVGSTGRATEANKWEEPAEWSVGWNAWVVGWLQALAAATPRPVRPGQQPAQPARAVKRT